MRPTLTIDSETALIEPNLNAPPLVCISWATGSAAGVMHRSEGWADFIRGAMAPGPHVLANHNIAFDVAVWWAADPYLIGPTIDAYERDQVTCTLVRQQLIDVARGERKVRNGKPPKYGLGGKTGLTLEFLGYDIEGKGGIQLRYSEVMDLPVPQWPDGFARYAIDDAKATLALYEYQRDHNQERVFVDEFRQARGHLWMYLSRVWSVAIDPQGVEDTERVLMIEKEGLARSLIANGLLTYDPKKRTFRRNLKAARALIVKAYADMGKDLPLTDKGNVSLARADVADADDDDLTCYSAFSAVDRTLTKDVKALKAACGPVRRINLPNGGVTFQGGNVMHPQIQPVLETGRVSYARPNIQNLPRKGPIRQCFVARPGCVLLAGDFTGFELATLAQAVTDLIGYSTLADQLNQGIDPHLVIGSQLGGVSYAEAVARYKAEDKQAEEWRQLGKVGSFGLPGGLGAETLIFYALQSFGLHIDLATSTLIRQTWYSTYREMRQVFQVVNAMCEAGEIVQARSGRVRGNPRFTAGANTIFQGPAADIAKYVGWYVMKGCYDIRERSALYGSRIVLFVHDEFVLEVPEPVLGPVARELKTVMVERARPWLPAVRLGADLKAMRRYCKKPTGDNIVEIPEC